jgi:ATP-dependent DNA ligase
MLCKRPTRTIEQTVKEMEGAEFIIEEKLDGERIQLHKRGNEYFYCSRSLCRFRALFQSLIISTGKAKTIRIYMGSMLVVGR